MKRGVYCSTELFLNSNGSYTKEDGCENHSSLWFGSWSKLNDSIYKLIPISESPIINSIEYQTAPAFDSGSILFKIYDNAGRPINRFFIFIEKFSNSPGIKYDDSYYVDENYVSKVFSTNKLGEVEINCSEFDSVGCGWLKFIINPDKKFPVNEFLGKVVVIRLNVNAEAMIYDDTSIDHSQDPIIFILRKNEILIEGFVLNER
ncbi:MAG: hypothetical protein ACHQFW_05340 [Chitinophagales bacterium]